MNILRYIVAVPLLVLGSLYGSVLTLWVLFCEWRDVNGLAASLLALYPPHWTSAWPIMQHLVMSFAAAEFGHFIIVSGFRRASLFLVLSTASMWVVEVVGQKCLLGFCPFGRYEWAPSMRSGYPFDNIKAFDDIALMSVVSSGVLYFGYSVILSQYTSTGSHAPSRLNSWKSASLAGLSCVFLSAYLEPVGYGPYDGTCYGNTGRFLDDQNGAFTIRGIPLRDHLLWFPICFIFSLIYNNISVLLFGEFSTEGKRNSVFSAIVPILLPSAVPFYSSLISRPLDVRVQAVLCGSVAPFLLFQSYFKRQGLQDGRNNLSKKKRV